MEQLAEARKVRLDQFKQVYTCEKDAKQVSVIIYHFTLLCDLLALLYLIPRLCKIWNICSDSCHRVWVTWATAWRRPQSYATSTQRSQELQRWPHITRAVLSLQSVAVTAHLLSYVLSVVTCYVSVIHYWPMMFTLLNHIF